MATLNEQLSQVIVSIFETGRAPASATETATNTRLVHSAFSDLDGLFEEALSKTNIGTYRNLQSRWNTLRKNHIVILKQVLSNWQYTSPSKSQKPPVPSNSDPKQPPSKVDYQEQDTKQQKIEELNAEIEQYKMPKAAGLVAAGDLIQAEKIYRMLANTRDTELKRKQEAGKGATTSELAGLRIKFELASVLSKRRKFDEAEDFSRHIFTRRRALLGTDHKETWSAQRQLCQILRSQSSYSKNGEAEMLYRAVWKTYDGKSKLGNSDTDIWVLENGRNLAIVLREEGDDMAIAQLKKVLKASNTTKQESQASALQLVQWHLDLRQASEAAKIIRDYLSSSSEPWTRETLSSSTNVAKALTKQRENASAETIWKRVSEELNKKFGSKCADAIDPAWQLALVQYNLAHYDAAKRTLHDLLRAKAGESAKSADVVAIHALLAACCSKVKDGPMAEKYARLVWQERGSEPPARDGGLPGPAQYSLVSTDRD
jgi:hypothetical protein